MVPSEFAQAMTFKNSWQEKPLLLLRKTKINTVVCFVSDGQSREAIARALRALCEDVRLVFISRNARGIGYSVPTYVVDQAGGNTYAQVFSQIRETCGQIDAMLYLRPLEDSSCMCDTRDILFILQALAESRLKAEKLLLAADPDSGPDDRYLDSWFEFERSIGLAFPQTKLALVCQPVTDPIDAHGMADWLQKWWNDWVQKLWSELQAARVQNVLYQSGKRHIRRMPPSIMSGVSSPLK